MPIQTLTVRPVTESADLAEVQALCWAYRAQLMATSPIDAELTRTFYPEPKYRRLMAGLAQAHARPQGIILLAEQNGAPVGCAMSHALDPVTSEVKRVFVSPEARGHGIARTLVTRLMSQARSDGFSRVVLDTSVSLEPARALYATLGFQTRGPYQHVPDDALPHLLFFEATL